MKYCVGIDLGSTTTKAVVLGDEGEVLGRGITNSRSNYGVACEVALVEALITARFGLIEAEFERLRAKGGGGIEELDEGWVPALERLLRLHQYVGQLESLAETITADLDGAGGGKNLRESATVILERMLQEAPSLYAPGTSRKSDFFRDLAGSRYLKFAEAVTKDSGVSYEELVGLYDKAILIVENSPTGSGNFAGHAANALSDLERPPEALARAVEWAGSTEMELAISVGTGYGRATLPFPREQIRSEILCHGLGAHELFPGTRTVLDIGGQDTKAIQVDDRGIVTSFQMNDRCAAGCGRYLGYIADEMNLGLHELGPLARQSKRNVKINSTCTVFAGAELRERLGLGEKREDILAGLHRAVILRAMSLLARSGGIEDQFTFTGGVAKNPAATDALKSLVEDNYGDKTINISADSIYTGALGAAIFARRDWLRTIN